MHPFFRWIKKNLIDEEPSPDEDSSLDEPEEEPPLPVEEPPLPVEEPHPEVPRPIRKTPRSGEGRKPSRLKKDPIRKSLELFALCLLVVILAALSVLNTYQSESSVSLLEQMLPLFFYAVGFPALLFGMFLANWKGDAGLFGAITLIVGIGLVIQFRMGSFSEGLDKPATLLPFPCGLGAFSLGILLCSKGRCASLSRFGWVAYAVALLGLLSMLVFGRKFRGGFYMPGGMNPTEIVKPMLVWFLAFFLCRVGKDLSETRLGIPFPPWRSVLWLAALWGVPLVLAVVLHDLGLMVLLAAILLTMVFVATGVGFYLLLGFGSVFAAAAIVQRISDHARTRFDVWLHPFQDPSGKSWQALQALSAMFSGGWWGAGLGAGLPQTVPIVTSDFIYAEIAEELGFVGCICILLAYLILFSRGFKAAGASRTPFERYLCAGLTASLALQTVLNIAGVTKALPMTGITLPFISHGGFSLVTTLFIAGMLVGLSDRKGQVSRS